MRTFRLPSTQADWVLLYCRIMALFAVQGAVLIILYAVRGFDADPDSMPPGLGLDPAHAVIHLVTGLIGTYFGFVRTAGAHRFLQLFTLFYMLLAIFGTFTDIHFGLQLEVEENLFHWPLSLTAALIAFAPQIRSTLRRSPA